MDEHFRTNRALWDGWARMHERSAFYDVDAFRAGALTLQPIELEQLGDVSGKRLLHLQCHLGLDTLSWARLGAQVTGVDFSPRAVSFARSLADELGLKARFVCSNVYDVQTELREPFDIVFASYGVLAWIPDVRRWAEIAASYLNPGGEFHLVEFHPVANTLDDSGSSLAHPYFHSKEPLRYQAQGSYAEPEAEFSHEAYEWTHSVADVLNALISAGLTIRAVREFAWTPYNCFPFLEEREKGRWYVRGEGPLVPLTFSIMAER